MDLFTKGTNDFFFLSGMHFNGQLISSNEESIELQFNPDEMPDLFNQQHTDAFNDFRTKRVEVFR